MRRGAWRRLICLWSPHEDMKLLVDMNLSPDWVPFLNSAGFEAIHWSLVGNCRAEDREIMEWAREDSFVVFTHDLDFGTLLALTPGSGSKRDPGAHRRYHSCRDRRFGP
jgi:hypothetical protein